MGCNYLYKFFLAKNKTDRTHHYRHQFKVSQQIDKERSNVYYIHLVICFAEDSPISFVAVVLSGEFLPTL